MSRRRKKSRTSASSSGGKPGASASSPPLRSSRLGVGLVVAAALFAISLSWIFRARIAELVPHSMRAATLGTTFEARPMNVVLVTADTLRADKLGCYGNREVATPNLDRLAEAGILFESAATATPVTLPSHASILTGTYPLFHGVRENGARALGKERSTLAEVLKAKGYRTGAFVGAFVLDSRWGLDQGFDRYSDDFTATRRRGDEVLDDALKWMDSARGGKFFSWIHFFDPHAPYEPPEPFRSRYAGDANGLYDGEVAYVDSLMGRLLDWIDGAGLADQTLVVFLADHGESLGEHGELTHGFFLYDATMRVPFLLRAPSGLAHGLRIPEQVRTIDVVPTVLDLLGIDPPGEVQGASLVPLIAGKSEEERAAYGESTFPSHYGWSPLESLRTRETLFVSAPRPELYDIGRDPGSERNLAPERAGTVREMEQRLKETRERYRSNAKESPGPAPLDEETRRKLAALGYLSSSNPSPDRSQPTALADPKDKIELFNAIRTAASDIDASRWREAIAKLQTVVGQDPDVVEAHTMLGRSYFSAGDWTRAVSAYQDALSLDPSYVTALFGLASSYQKLGRLDEAVAGLGRVLQLEPRFTGAALLLAQIDVGRQKFREALSTLEHMEPSESESERAAVESAKAECFLGLKDFDSAVRAYQKAVAVSPRDHVAHFNLAKVLGQIGKQDEMIAELQKSIETDPSFTVGHLYLANAYLDRGNLEKAVELAQKGIELQPEPSLAPFGHFILADAYDRLGRKKDSAREMELAKRLQSAIH
jgi:arylsulfatase A-like enzyme/cytochrome c-type biogenesis protein CcmH/NrfG